MLGLLKASVGQIMSALASIATNERACENGRKVPNCEILAASIYRVKMAATADAERTC